MRPNALHYLGLVHDPGRHVTIDGQTANLPDSNRVLNTGGVDSAGCPDTGFVAVRREESVQWTTLN